jgi:hypothetical protein
LANRDAEFQIVSDDLAGKIEEEESACGRRLAKDAGNLAEVLACYPEGGSVRQVLKSCYELYKFFRHSFACVRSTEFNLFGERKGELKDETVQFTLPISQLATL